ncbi:MAG: circadian clock protein KaiC [Gemmatimonadaceae bacterium]|nr:circadian clock protein KaiC [Gemmatimonadaceae bacterium]MDQ3519517.1 circadian clock protein KaiC [Gemmatimonadota bacterium]
MPVEKIATGISSFDIIAKGGLPRNRTTLISGTAGSGKTIFAVQFLGAGIEQGIPAVFVTFEESATDIRKNMLSFGWDLEKWEADGKLAFVDASPDPMTETVEAGSFDLGALLARVQHAVRKVKAERVAVDSLGAVFSQFSDQSIVRSELFRIASALKAMNVTAVLTAERTDDYGPIARFGVEEFIADNVMILRNVLEDESRRRTIEILKFRGCDHQKGEYPFTIVPEGGVIVIPLSAMHLSMKSSNVRISSGNQSLDEMCGGGLFRDSVTLVSGATGTGKTLTVTQFLQGGASNGERCLLLAFEESRDQLVRNASGWGFDFDRMERDGQLRVVCDYPDVSGLEDWLVIIQAAIRDFKPHRVALDSLSALEHVGSPKAFREFVIGLTSFVKHQEITTLFTSTTENLMGGDSITATHISTLTDSIILLRYVEMFGEMKRGLTVLKMRGSAHDKAIREFTIDKGGMRMGRPFRNVTGILAGAPVHVSPGDLERVWAEADADRAKKQEQPQT